MPSRLIVNADDFGQTAGINDAIEELYRAGALSSATLMAGGTHFDSAVRIARNNPGLGVGCHLVFVDGTPILPAKAIPSLLGRDGRSFRTSLFEFAGAVTRGQIAAEHIALEAEAQIERLLSAGVQVTHVDSHKHTHLFPSVLAPVLSAARACGVRAMRRPFDTPWSARLAGAPWLRRMQLVLLGRLQGSFNKLTADLRNEQRVPDATLGIAATGTLDTDGLRALLAAMPHDGVFELCCHPGHVDAELESQRTRLRASRETEYGALLQVIPEMLRTAGGPRLIHYGELGRPGSGLAQTRTAPSD